MRSSISGWSLGKTTEFSPEPRLAVPIAEHVKNGGVGVGRRTQPLIGDCCEIITDTAGELEGGVPCSVARWLMGD